MSSDGVFLAPRIIPLIMGVAPPIIPPAIAPGLPAINSPAVAPIAPPVILAGTFGICTGNPLIFKAVGAIAPSYPPLAALETVLETAEAASDTVGAIDCPSLTAGPIASGAASS